MTRDSCEGRGKSCNDTRHEEDHVRQAGVAARPRDVRRGADADGSVVDAFDVNDAKVIIFGDWPQPNDFLTVSKAATRWHGLLDYGLVPQFGPVEREGRFPFKVR